MILDARTIVASFGREKREAVITAEAEAWERCARYAQRWQAARLRNKQSATLEDFRMALIHRGREQRRLAEKGGQ